MQGESARGDRASRDGDEIYEELEWLPLKLRETVHSQPGSRTG